MEKTKRRSFNKYEGAICGAAVGDALGWPSEQNSKNVTKAEQNSKEIFRKWSRREGGQFWSHYEDINPGEYSDDTQLIIATARSLRYGEKWSQAFTKIELPAWLSYERGGGGATKRAAQSWKRKNTPWDLEKEKRVDVERYFNAGGNGVAMRILPHIFNNEMSYEDIMNQIFINGIFTHGHPRALIGAMVYADALLYLLELEETLGYGELIEYLLNRKDKWANFPDANKTKIWLNVANVIHGDNYKDLWEEVAREMIDLLKIAKDGIDDGALDMGNSVLERMGCFNKNINGAGTVTAGAAIYLSSKYASSPKLGLLEAAYLQNADTDTLASMVGGILGMIHGQEFMLNSWITVQDYEYLKKLVYIKPIAITKSNIPLFDYSNARFKNALKQIKKGETIKASPFGLLTAKEKVLNKSNVNEAVIHTLKLISEEGQSIFVKIFEKSTRIKGDFNNGEQNKKLINQQLKISNDISRDVKGRYKSQQVVLTEKMIRNLVNILPKEISLNEGFGYIADIMYEMERSDFGNIDDRGMELLVKRWGENNISSKQINRIKDVIIQK